jgi:AcrR family transcriptional regulator
VGSTERRTRAKLLLREEILDAARELFLKHGYENVSMRKIAGKIEYSPTTIYLYFKDKAEILQTLCDETFGRLYKVMGEIARGTGDPVAKLRQLGIAYIHFGLEHANHYQITFMMPVEGAAGPDPFEKSAGMQTFECLMNCVQDCVKSGAFRKLDVLASSQAIWCAVHGVTSLLISHREFPWVAQEELISTLLDATIDGMRAPAEAAKSKSRK